MKYEPKQKNKIPEVTVAALFVCAGVAFGFSAIELIPGKGILQSLALIILCAMIFVFVKYKATNFCYSITVADKPAKSLHHEDDEETVKEGGISYEDALSMPVTAVPPEMLRLVVEKKQGRGVFVKECALELTDIERCFALPEEKDDLQALLKSDRKIGRYVYFKNMSPADQMVVIASPKTGKVAVFLEYEKKFCDYLKAIAVYNKK